MAFEHQLIWAQPRPYFTLFAAHLVCPFNLTTVVENVMELFKEYIGRKPFSSFADFKRTREEFEELI